MTGSGLWDIVGSCPRLIFSRCNKFVKVSTGSGRQLRASANNKGYMKVNYKDLKKNDEVRTTQLGTPVSGKLIESPKQGRGLKRTILIWSKGSEIGMFDEHGSVWATDVSQVLRDGAWLQVTGQPA